MSIDTIDASEVDLPLGDEPLVDPWEHAVPITPPPPGDPEPEPGLTPAVRAMVAELDAHYKGGDCPSIDKTAAAMKDATGSKSWDSRGQVDKARKAYRAKHGIDAKPATKTARTVPARTTAPRPARTTVVRADPVPAVPPVVRAEPQPVVQPPVPQPPAVVEPEPVPQPQPAVRTKPVRRAVVWPVVLLALPAFVAIWSGWVGLGGLTGFGVVHPLPGIADSVSLDTAITLPIGVETYGAYALYIWLSGRVPDRARRFAKWSAFGSLAVGALGQVAYHLLVAPPTGAPWWITTAVSVLPVAVLGMGAALAHLVREEN